MALSELEEVIYQHLRGRMPQKNPESGKITYRDLVLGLPRLEKPYADLHWRDPRLDEALGDLVKACRAANLPAISAVVVNAEKGKPGKRYYDVAHPGLASLQQEIAWAQELINVAATNYPESL